MKLKYSLLLVGLLTLWLVAAPGARAQFEDNEDEAAAASLGDDDEAEEISGHASSSASQPQSSATEAEQPAQKPVYIEPVPIGDYHFVETFDANDLIGKKWIKSKAKKGDVEDSIAKYDGEWSIEAAVDSALDGDRGLVLKSRAKHHAISSRLLKSFDFKNNKPLVVQYEVKFQNPMDCGGAYVKLLADETDLNLENFYDKSSFSIMFGPDKCGNENKYHFIVRHKNPVKGTYEEKHAKKSEMMDGLFSDGKTHLYTLVLKPDGKFRMLIDSIEVNSGHLGSDLTPAIQPPKEIVDPHDTKPETWDDREKIADPEAVKPDEWDETEPKTIADPSAQKPAGWLDEEPDMIADTLAVKPEDWDVETDGEWEAPKVDNPACKEAPGCGAWNPPLVNNPKYKGKWRAPLIDNINYQGKWEPRKIDNPDYFEESNLFGSLTPFAALGIELWSMTDQIYFDNFLITDDESVADQFAKDSWVLKKNQEGVKSKSSDSVLDVLISSANEKPWLWAVYVLVCLVPIVLIAVFCFGGKSPSSSRPVSSTTAQVKKTDATTKDDEPAAESEEQAAEQATTITKEALEQDEEEEEEPEQEQEEQEVEANANEADAEDKTSNEENVGKKSTRRRPKKDN